MESLDSTGGLNLADRLAKLNKERNLKGNKDSNLKHNPIKQQPSSQTIALFKCMLKNML